MKNQIHAHLDVRPTPDGLGLSVRVVSQMPAVAKSLPFTAADGTVVGVVGSGRPFIGFVGDRLYVGLRGPEVSTNDPVLSHFRNQNEVAQAAKSAKAAVSELRHTLNMKA